MKLFKQDRLGMYSQSELRKVEFTAFANLPRPYKIPNRKELDATVIQQRLAELRRSPVRLLEAAAHIQSSLNQAKLKPNKRLELTLIILRQSYPQISEYYDAYQGKANSLPEKKERRDALVACISVVSEVAVSYKHLFSESFTADDAAYRKARNVIYEHAFRIFEMTLVEQRLRALRYQRLPRSAWRDCNQIFFAMALHNDFFDPCKLTGLVGIRKRESRSGGRQTSERNLLQLYLSVQLFGVLDVSTWPTNLFYVPEAYMSLLNPGIKITGDDGQPLKEGHMLTWLNNQGPPVFDRPTDLPGPTVQIDFTVYNNALVKDYETLASMKFLGNYDPRKLSRPLQKIPEEDRIPVLQMLLAALRKRRRKAQRHTLFDRNQVAVYFGMREVMSLLVDTTGPERGNKLGSRQFTDTLARSHALLLDGEQKEIKTQWQILNFSAGGVLISTLENDFSRVVALGQLVAFIPYQDTSQPSLGYVCRLNRPEDQVVEVGIARLGNYAEVIILENIVADRDAPKLPAILVQNTADNWQLIVRPGTDLLPGSPVRLLRDRAPAPARLGDIYLTKKEFMVFELRSPGLQRLPPVKP
jgi:hypothetical protein